MRDKSQFKLAEVFHSSVDQRRKHLHIILVEPENGGNVGAICRARANMAIMGRLSIVGSPAILNSEAEKMAKHAKDAFPLIGFYPSLNVALNFGDSAKPLTIAATARIGSSDRPHPVLIRDAIPRAITKLESGLVSDIVLVFGRESSGLTNEEVGLCDWITTIPSSDEYRSLNLAQAVMIFCYELNTALLPEPIQGDLADRSQKGRLIEHILRLAETVGFVHDGDPHKMRPRLEEILAHLPNHIQGVRTLHGFLDQAIRSIKKGEADIRGRYKN